MITIPVWHSFNPILYFPKFLIQVAFWVKVDEVGGKNIS